MMRYRNNSDASKQRFVSENQQFLHFLLQLILLINYARYIVRWAARQR